MGKKLKDTASEFEKLEAIKKLNEELTAENARLLMELDNAKDISIKKSVLADYAESRLITIQELENQLEEVKKTSFVISEANQKNIEELTSIKSKWWYKLMTWGW